MGAESIRSEVIRMVGQASFRRFILSLENREHVRVDHPENIAFDPEGKSAGFCVISGRVRFFGTSERVTSAATADSVEHLG